MLKSWAKGKFCINFAICKHFHITKLQLKASNSNTVMQVHLRNYKISALLWSWQRFASIIRACFSLSQGHRGTLPNVIAVLWVPNGTLLASSQSLCLLVKRKDNPLLMHFLSHFCLYFAFLSSCGYLVSIAKTSSIPVLTGECPDDIFWLHLEKAAHNLTVFWWFIL